MKARISREGIWLEHIVLLALLLRAGLALLPRVIRWDEPDYLWLGHSLLTGHGYTINGVPELHYTPLYPLLSGLVFTLSGNPELGSAVWYVLFGALLCLPIYAIARRMYGPRVALVAALLVAIFPALSSEILYWGTMTEPLYILLACTALWAAVQAVDRDRWWAFAALGVLLGLAFLTRPEGIVWFGCYMAMVLLVLALDRRLWRWRTLAQVGLALGAFALVIAPYLAFMHRQTGKLLLTGKLSITYDIGQAVLEQDPVLYDKVTASIDEETGEILWWSPSRFERSTADLVLGDPVSFLQRTWANLAAMRDALLSPTTLPVFLLLPLFLGWFRQPWTRRRWRYELMLLLAALPVLSFLPFHVEVRFFSPAFPILLIWVAVGLWEMGAWLAETAGQWRLGTADGEVYRSLFQRWQPLMVTALVLVLTAYLGFGHVRTVRRGINSLGFAHKQAGLWLRENTPADAAIMSRDLAISLYAERGFVVSPRASYEAYLEYGRAHGATYLVVDERELHILRPHLAFLLDDQMPPPELEPVFAARDNNGRTIVYRIKEPTHVN
jgi:4-amino-4-deoxy-L-arabinose transferase-like glycosyltransferase